MAVVTSCPPSDFLSAQFGDVVAIKRESPFGIESPGSWWVGYVIHIVRGARDPFVNSLFQVVDVDTGNIEVINADLVIGVISHGNDLRKGAEVQH